MAPGRTISAILPEDNTTWEHRLFLTIDIDWAHDDVLADTIDLIEQADVCCTWFVTHHTPLLGRLRANPKFELGIHPNFNRLLEGDCRNGAGARDVVARLMEIVPEARSVRSHSMMQSSIILDIFAEAGLTHDVNHFIPTIAQITTKPWRLWNGMVRVPYHWEDDVTCLYLEQQMTVPEIGEIVAQHTFCVFDFHPIHVFLNTESLDRYERTRPIHYNPKELIKYRYEGYGTRNRLYALLELAEA